VRRTGWIVTVVLLAAWAAALGAALCLRLPAFTQRVWDRWAEVGPSGVMQTLRLEGEPLTAVGVGLGCDGGGCAATLTLTDATGRVVAQATVRDSALENVACPIRRPYRWVRLDVGAMTGDGTAALRVVPLPDGKGRLLVRASGQDVYAGGDAEGIEGVADLSFQLFDQVSGLEGFGRLLDRAAAQGPGFLAWRGWYAVLAGLVAALGAGLLVAAGIYAAGTSGRPGQKSP